MLQIDGYKLSANRGDVGTFDFKTNVKGDGEYYFNVGDVLSFGIYNKKEMDKDPLFFKEYTVNEPTNIVTIVFENEDLSIGEIINKPVEYWYEIKLNNQSTLLGYDKNGPKTFMIYPEGADKDESGIN